MGSSIIPSPEGQPDLVVGVLYQFKAAAAQDSAVRHAVQRAGDVAEHASDAGDEAQLHTRANLRGEQVEVGLEKRRVHYSVTGLTWPRDREQCYSVFKSGQPVLPQDSTLVLANSKNTKVPHQNTSPPPPS